MPQNPEIVINSIDKVQSKYTYIQASGSNQSDGSTQGVHLRWDFREELSEKHLPKGDLLTSFPSDSKFSKPDDFVKVFKTQYLKKYPAIVDFTSNVPDRINTGSVREWEFDIQIDSIANELVITTIIIRFSDIDAYDTVLYDPLISPFDFLKSYEQFHNAHIEVEAKNKLSFAVTFGMIHIDQGLQGTLRTEAISTYNFEDNVISCRKTINVDAYSGPQPDIPLVDNTAFLHFIGSIDRIEVENIKYVRFRYENISPYQIIVETYHDFIIGTNNDNPNDWQEIDQFALSIDDSDVYERLEGPSGNNWNIDTWPRFINNKQVDIINYQKKWFDSSGSGDGIKDGVLQYLQLSSSGNPGAVVTVQNEPQPNSSNTEISYLDLLKLVSMDYHIARMLGLGYIDKMDLNVGGQKFIYLMLYDTIASIEGVPQGTNVRHFYMTMPTSIADSYLPDIPDLCSVEYGLEIPATPNPIQLTQNNGYGDGYLPYHDIRYIRLFRNSILHELPFSQFFYETSDEFCTKGTTETLFYGVEYRLQGNPWNSGLSYDSELDEVIPIPNPVNNSAIFTHAETEIGTHDYAIYGINWFSRPSDLSDIQSTDATVFPIRNTLLPPSNFAVQLIQKEQPRVFTSLDEQGMLNTLISNTGDENAILVRATFYWNHLHYMGYQFDNQSPGTFKLKADQIQIFFRQNAPASTRGKITNVNDPGNNKVEVTVGPYNDNTQNPPVTYTPAIVSGVQYKYFKSDEKSYLIDSIQDMGNGILIFTLFKNYETELMESEPNEFTATQNQIIPNANDYFSVSEDISEPDISVWPKKLSAVNSVIDIYDFETTIEEDGTPSATHIHTETRTGSENQDVTLNIGGIFEKATITEVLDIDQNGIDVPNSRTGIFKIEFAGDPLTDHQGANVEWYKGTVRIKYDPNLNLNPNYGNPNPGYELDLEEKKVLEVVDIGHDITGVNLVLTVVDSTFEIDAPAPGYYNITGTYQPIMTGNDVLVNFHPGYRVYLYGESGFDKSEILPVTGAGIKKTYMAANSIDNSELLESNVSSPSVLMALEIIPPLPPGEPTGPTFATRPDYYGKSTYTFDTEVIDDGTRKPFALIFYRANERSILDTLYKKDTITTILADIEALSDDEKAFMPQYWHAMVNVVVNPPGHTHYGEFADPLEGTTNAGTFQFPLPDNDEYIDPITGAKPFEVPSPITDTSIVVNAIIGTFLPLTKQPVIYDQIDYPEKQTRKDEPVLYDDLGNRLAPTDTSYDPFPMVVRYYDSNKMYVRFTDFTIDGASTAIYFYYAAEMTNKMQLSEPSPIAGPIQLVNAYPPEKPEIRKVTTILDNPVLNETASVRLEINKYLPADKISGIQIYRTLRKDDAKSVRTMKLVKNIEQDLQAVPPILFEDIQELIIDDFSDLTMPPYRETLFYRLVVLRKIINEQGIEENIPSEPSELSLASIVDVVNPEAPELSYEAGEVTNPDILPGVVLKWNKTVHNGTYYLYKMNNAGNWELIDTIITNDEHVFYEIGDIDKTDEDDNTVYVRYKVSVENTSGLLNLTDKELTI